MAEKDGIPWSENVRKSRGLGLVRFEVKPKNNIPIGLFGVPCWLYSDAYNDPHLWLAGIVNTLGAIPHQPERTRYHGVMEAHFPGLVSNS